MISDPATVAQPKFLLKQWTVSAPGPGSLIAQKSYHHAAAGFGYPSEQTDLKLSCCRSRSWRREATRARASMRDDIWGRKLSVPYWRWQCPPARVLHPQPHHASGLWLHRALPEQVTPPGNQLYRSKELASTIAYHRGWQASACGQLWAPQRVNGGTAHLHQERRTRRASS